MTRRRSTAAAAALACTLALAGIAQPVAAQLAPPPVPVLDPAPASWPTVVGIDAAAYVLVEGETGQILAGRAADTRRPVASTVKILTALTAITRVDLDEPVTVGDEVVGVDGADVGLQPGDTWTVEELLEAILARSGNEAAEALAVHVAGSSEAFTRLMQQDAVALGLEEPPIVSVSGLDDANLLSARDLATISRVALAHPDLGPILAREIVTLPGQSPEFSRNLLLGRYPGATGVKTGFTDAAGNSLIGSAVRGERELIAVVLGAGEDPARFDQVAQLLDLGFDRTVRTELDARLELAVAGGSVAIVVDPVTVTVPVDRPAGLSMPLPIRPPEGDLPVPIDVDGEVLGTAVGTLDSSGRPAPAQGEDAIGRAAVDGAYAALRAAAAAGHLG